MLESQKHQSMLFAFLPSQPTKESGKEIQLSLRVVMARRKARSLQSRIIKRRENATFKSNGRQNFHDLALQQTNLEEKYTASTVEKMKQLTLL